MFLSTFATHPFLVEPIFKPILLCIKMSSSSNGSSFLTFHGKKYDPTFDWHDEEGLLQDPKTHAPYSHMEIKLSVFLGFLCLEKCCFMFHCKFDGETLSICCVFLLEFGVWYDWSCCNVGFGVFLKCLFFLLWCNLDNVGSLWCRWINYGLDFGGIGSVKNLCYGLVWICSWCMWEILLSCVNFVSWTWQNFVGMCMDKFVGMKFDLWKIFCWVCDVGSCKIFVVMILAMWEFTFCA